jgi:hypothetical protein
VPKSAGRPFSCQVAVSLEAEIEKEHKENILKGQSRHAATFWTGARSHAKMNDHDRDRAQADDVALPKGQSFQHKGTIDEPCNSGSDDHCHLGVLRDFGQG